MTMILLSQVPLAKVELSIKINSFSVSTAWVLIAINRLTVNNMICFILVLLVLLLYKDSLFCELRIYKNMKREILLSHREKL